MKTDKDCGEKKGGEKRRKVVRIEKKGGEKRRKVVRREGRW